MRFLNDLCYLFYLQVAFWMHTDRTKSMSDFKRPRCLIENLLTGEKQNINGISLVSLKWQIFYQKLSRKILPSLLFWGNYLIGPFILKIYSPISLNIQHYNLNLTSNITSVNLVKWGCIFHKYVMCLKLYCLNKHKN